MKREQQRERRAGSRCGRGLRSGTTPLRCGVLLTRKASAPTLTNRRRPSSTGRRTARELDAVGALGAPRADSVDWSSTAYGTPGIDPAAGVDSAGKVARALLARRPWCIDLGVTACGLRPMTVSTLAVEVTGSGPGLLLVHGHGGAKEDFADHVERLRAASHGRDVRPPRARQERPPDRSGRVLVGPDARRRLGGCRRGRARPIPRARPLDGRHGRAAHAARAAGTHRGAGDDGHERRAGARPGSRTGRDRPPTSVSPKERTRSRRSSTRPARSTPRPINDCSSNAQGYREFQDRKWADTSVVMWSTVAVEIARPARRPPADA